MRHRIDHRKLGRTRPHRQALLRNLTTSLFEHEKIVTTVPKAKELRRLAEKMITLGKRGDLHARRQVLAVVRDESVVKRLFDTISPRYKERPGGYTRIIKLNQRVGDGAPMAAIELVEEFKEKVEKPKKLKKPTVKAAPKEKVRPKIEPPGAAPEKKVKAKAPSKASKTEPETAKEQTAAKPKKGKKT
jgi:large subunit ribosomal protein L17